MFIPVWTMQSQGAISVYENANYSYQFGECSHRELSVFMRMLNGIPVWRMLSQGAISVYENAKCSYQFGECSHRELSVYLRMPNVHTSLENAVTGSYQCL